MAREKGVPYPHPEREIKWVRCGPAVPFDEYPTSPFGFWERERIKKMAAPMETGIWEVFFVIEGEEGEEGERADVWEHNVVADSRESAVALAALEMEADTMKRLKKTVCRPVTG